jgi:hypothetical protein
MASTPAVKVHGHLHGDSPWRRSERRIGEHGVRGALVKRGLTAALDDFQGAPPNLAITLNCEGDDDAGAMLFSRKAGLNLLSESPHIISDAVILVLLCLDRYCAI